jgi:hypothetical protein
MKLGNAIAIAAMTAACVVLSESALAHCDSLDGPVVRDARAALAHGDPTPVLKWVTAENESGIRDAFAKTLAVRSLGNDARLLADRYFFETLVRVHRAGEGEPFTGLKPAGRIDPGLSAADAALEAGTAERLARQLSQAVEGDISTRFNIALERKKHSAESVAAGRAYVAAYVDYVHFVESVHRLTEKGAPHKHHEGE